jgi:hypothetical protein
MKFLFCFNVLILYFNLAIFSQNRNDINSLKIEDAIENSAEDLNESGQNEIPEELQQLADRPLDLNGNNFEILLRYNLITQEHIDAIYNYRKKYGDLVEPEELQQVEGFDKKTIMQIIAYCTVIKERSIQRTNRLTLRFQKAGNNIKNYYPGSDLKILSRFQSVLSNSLRFAFTGEKDAGEEFFSRRTKGFDFNSTYLFYTGNRTIRKIILGDFNLEYGQGLTLWTGLNFNSASNIATLYKAGRGIIPYSGTDENRFFRGAAISIKNNKISFDTWFSYHGIDGNLVNDTLQEKEYISSFQTTGYHRTYGEIIDYHSQHEKATGFNVNFATTKLAAGITVSYQHFAIPVSRSNKPYAKNKFYGNETLNAGMNYSYSFKNLFYFGEFTVDKNSSFATLQGIIMSIDSRMSVGILWRSYSADFINLKSNAFGINSENSNEHGTLFGINYKITRTISYSAYTDLYTFPYLKYRVDQPSSGNDLFNQLDYIPNKKFSAQFRYRKKMKQQNSEDDFSGLNIIDDFTTRNFRFNVRYKIDSSWEFGSRIEITKGENNSMVAGKATIISQDVFYHPMGKPFSINFRYAIFDCPDYDTRIYTYENDVQGAFSVPYYYGTGNRFYVNVSSKLFRATSISVRYAVSMFDENQSSTNKPDLKIQMKLIF